MILKVKCSLCGETITFSEDCSMCLATRNAEQEVKQEIEMECKVSKAMTMYVYKIMEYCYEESQMTKN